MTENNTITMTLTEIEMLALRYAELDPETLFQSQAEGRANMAIEEIVKKEMERALDAGEALPSSRDKIVQQAFKKGTVKSAEQRAKDVQNAATIGAPPPKNNVETMKATVAAHALFLKVNAVNAHLPKGSHYPVNREGLGAIIERYNHIISAFNTAKNLGMDVTKEEEKQAGLILRVYQYHTVVDNAVGTILFAGDPADPIKTDTRWP